MQKEKLKDWLNRQFFKHDEDLGPCCKLVCRHLGADARTKTGDVFQIMVQNNEKVVTLDDDELEILCNQIEAGVLEDAEGIGGLQKYQLLAYHTKAARPVSRYTFRMSGSELDEYEDGMTETPTKQGHIAQMMRHNEGIMRIAVMGANQSIGLLNRTVSRQAQQIEKLLDQRMEEFELIENLRSQRHERDLMTKEADNREQRYQELYEKGSLLIPVIANKIAGRKILPEKLDPMTEMLKSFAETLTPAQVSDMLPRLRPEQQIAFLEFLEKVKDAEEDKEQKKLPGGTNGA